MKFKSEDSKKPIRYGMTYKAIQKQIIENMRSKDTPLWIRKRGESNRELVYEERESTN